MSRSSVSAESQKQQLDDRQKLKLCRANGVDLVQVPFFPSDMQSFDDAVRHVSFCLDRVGIAHEPPRVRKVEKLFAVTTSEPMRRLRNLARERGGRCLSSAYLGMAKKYEWECSDGHSWSALASSVNMGTWCKKCDQNAKRRAFADKFEAYIEGFGGRLLSPYVSSTTPIKVCCAKGHRISALPADLKRSPLWCSEC